MINRALPITGLCLALSGCVTTTEQPSRPDSDRRDSDGPDLVSQLEAVLPGTYSNYAQHHEAPEKTPSLEMTIRRRASDTDSVSMLVEQRQRRGDGPPRRYLWRIRQNQQAGAPAVLEFAPLRNGRPARACAMRLQPSRAGIAASTIPGNCRLQGGSGRTVELRREILVRRDGGIVLGERVHDPESGEPLGEARRLAFEPQLTYGGWAGVKPRADGKWRIARPIALHDQGDREALVDRGGNELGYALELARVKQRRGQPAVLRLAVVDTADNRQVAYAWAQAGSRFIGVNLGWLQAGLTLGGKPEPASE